LTRFFLTLGAFLILSLPLAAGASSITAKPKLIVGGDLGNPPHEYLENGKPTGFNVELVRAVAEVMGFDVDIRLVPWSRARHDLEQGKIDVLAGMYSSAERSRLVDFSVPHTMVSSGIFVRKDSPIRSFRDIRGKEIIVQAGNVFHDYLRENGLASRIIAVTDAEETLRLLASGKHDCAFMPSRLQGEYFVRKYGLTNLKVITTGLPPLRDCFAVHKGNRELLYKLDEGLNILKVTGKYREIYDRWFGVYERKELWETVRYYVLALALVVVLCLAFFIWSGMLKRRVEQRTAALRRSEEELRFSEARYRALHRDNPTMIFTLDTGGTVLSVNPTGADKLGYTIDELEGQSVLKVFHEDDRPAVTEQLRECLLNPNKAYSWQFRKIRKDGGLLWVEELAQAVYGLDGMLNILVVCQDVTERKQAEESLRESEEMFRVLAETSPSGICLYQGERIVYVNPATSRLFGYSEQECLQMRFWDWVHEDSKEMVRERGLARQRGEPVPSRYECRHVRKDGGEIWIIVSTGRIDYGGMPACIVTFFDITGHKRMEEELQLAHDDLEMRVKERTAELARTTEALKASEQEKSLILNITDAHVIYYDAGMNILWANKAAGDSVNMTQEELQKLHCWEVWHQRHEPCTGCPVLLARETGLLQEAEVRTYDGRVWSVRAYPVRNETGRLIGMVEFTLDFTERKRMEEALRQANLVVENSPAMLFRGKVAEGWPVEMVSGNVVQIGYTPDEFLSGAINFPSIIHPQDLERVETEIRNNFASGNDQFRLEYRIVTKGGDVRWVNDHSATERDAGGNITHIQGIVIDITERKEIEIELRKNKEKYQAIVDQIDGYIYIASSDYRILFMNESVGKLFGYSEPGEFCYRVMHDRDSACPDCRSQEVFEGKTVRREWFNPKNGRFYHVTDTPIFHADGSIVRQTVATDITERKLAEEQLEQRKQQLEELNNTLENRVREEVEKNREKDVVLIQQNRQAALGEMLDHIAHQWKQPLNTISLIIQDLGETWSCGELNGEYITETIDKTTALLEHMAQTIDVFRDFYRPEKEKTVFRIKDSIDKALSFIAPALRFQAIVLDLDVDPELSAIGYPKEYAQVLLNILSNARDAVKERGTASPKVKVKAFAEDNKAVVTITDNAGGIPDTIVGKIFELYFTTKESCGGTGIGLYMSKNIIEKNMGGRLSAGNTDKGAQFRIELDMSG
jgi:PAS domain S-box-containing protein